MLGPPSDKGSGRGAAAGRAARRAGRPWPGALKISRILVKFALIGGLAGAAPQAAAWRGVPTFETPRFEAARRAALADLARGETEAALSRAGALARQWPEAPAGPALQAMALAGAGRDDDAVAALQRAARLGLDDIPGVLALPAFAALRDDPRLRGLDAVPRPRPDPDARPAAVDGWGTVADANTAWDPAPGMFRVAFAFPPKPSRDRGPATRKGEDAPEMRLLASLRRRGLAAGHVGDLYDNRDRRHSRMDRGPFPQLGGIGYAEAARRIGLDYGLNDRVLFSATVFGNSSTALTTGPAPRSQPRHAMTAPGAPARLFALYAANHLYVYPEHRDHDGETGDRFPAALPYVVVSQGSSGSDRPFLRAIALMLAALRPDAKAALRERGLIAPTLQMLLRMSRAGDAATYLTGRAHPSAFRGGEIDFVDLVRRANALRADAIPPMPRMRMIAEPTPAQGIELFGEGLSERLFDTPSAIARVARGLDRTRRYVLDAGATTDPNGRPLRFHWRVLRGDPERVRVRPLDPEGRRVEITAPWTERGAVPGRPGMWTDRVEIGLFVDNGAAWSAPAFFTVYFPPRQRRDHDAEGRLRMVDFADPARAKRYEDPLLIPSRDWRDDFERDAAGRLLGWTRTRGGRTERFTRHGARVIETDALGRPVRAERVVYDVVPAGNGGTRVAPRGTGEILLYGYDAPGDRLGHLTGRAEAG